MSPLELEDKIWVWLQIQPRDETFTSSTVLQGALGIEFHDRTPETQRLFQMLRRAATGRLAEFVTRGTPYEVSGQTRRPFIWHSRPQKSEADILQGRPSWLPSPEDTLAPYNLEGRLARLEEKIDCIERAIDRRSGHPDA